MSSGETAARPPSRRLDQSRPDSVDLEQTFDIDSLHILRQTVAAHADRIGANDDQLERLIIVTSELAINAIRHGGGQGRLLLWRNEHAIICEVSDQGPGIKDPAAGTSPPNPLSGESGGRGLWICRKLTSELRINTGPDGRGTVVRAAIPH